MCSMKAISAYALVWLHDHAGGATCRGGWDIYLFFFFSWGHLILCAVDVARMHSDNLPMKQCWSHAGCVASSVDSRQWRFSNWVLYRKPKIGAAKSSINKACDGLSGFSCELLQFFVYSSSCSLSLERTEQYVGGTQNLTKVTCLNE